MKRRAKSYWTPMCCETDRDRSAVKSWFSPLCDDMEPVEASILCDIATDREKKLRVVMRDKNGRRRVAVRSKRRSGWTITLTMPKAETAVDRRESGSA